MYSYNNLYEVNSAIGFCCNGYESLKIQSGYGHSKYKQWDYIIGTVCTGCGRLLSRYDTGKGRAFCYQCSQILFPEPEHRSTSYKKDSVIPGPRGILYKGFLFFLNMKKGLFHRLYCFRLQVE